MGTQQLLLIVLGVIIVGIAIAVGITIFNNQAYNSNQQAVASELNNYSQMAIQWWKTPVAQGGAGQAAAEFTLSKASTWIGLPSAQPTTNTTDSGKFWVNSVVADSSLVYIRGIGVEKKGGVEPKVEARVNLTTSSITTKINAF